MLKFRSFQPSTMAWLDVAVIALLLKDLDLTLIFPLFLLLRSLLTTFNSFASKKSGHFLSEAAFSGVRCSSLLPSEVLLSWCTLIRPSSWSSSFVVSFPSNVFSLSLLLLQLSHDKSGGFSAAPLCGWSEWTRIHLLSWLGGAVNDIGNISNWAARFCFPQYLLRRNVPSTEEEINGIIQWE